MFKVGDRVVYPMHGAGFIEGIVQQTVGGQLKDYYDIRIHGGNIRLKLPVLNVGVIRLREVMGSAEAREVLEYFKELQIDQNVPWGKRYKENVEHLKTGNPKEVVGVVKALMLRDKVVGLSTGDRQVMVLSKNILCSELSLALEQEISVLFETLQGIIDETIG